MQTKAIVSVPSAPTLCAGAFIASCVLALSSIGCIGPMASGNFDRTLSVNGPIQIELRGGSGRVEVHTGSSNEVRIHGDYEVYGNGFESARHEAEDLAARPPIDQHGQLIRIGTDVERFTNASISYSISVPAQTEARITMGSGSVDVSAIDGPLEISAGSGRVSARDIHQDVRVGTGSGAADLQGVGGRVNAIVRSGGLSISDIGGDVSAEAGSGHINIFHVRGRIEAHGGSGGVDVTGATQDLRATTSSGHLSVSGSPGRGAYWDIRASSGRVTLDIPSDLGYQLSAHSSSGTIRTSHEMIVQETGRHNLRGTVGDGAARIEVETRSGSIEVR